MPAQAQQLIEKQRLAETIAGGASSRAIRLQCFRRASGVLSSPCSTFESDMSAQ
jgi:hypothetical protein